MGEVVKIGRTVRKAKRAAVKTSVAKPKTARQVRRDRKAIGAGIAYAAIAAAGMALSLSHQAHGVASSTTASGWETWAMAVEIDLGLIASKLTPYICRTDAERDAVDVYAKPLSIAALLLCAWFNACGFSGYAPTGFARGAACVILGCAVPAIIYALSQMASLLLLGRK